MVVGFRERTQPRSDVKRIYGAAGVVAVEATGTGGAQGRTSTLAP